MVKVTVVTHSLLQWQSHDHSHWPWFTTVNHG